MHVRAYAWFCVEDKVKQAKGLSASPHGWRRPSTDVFASESIGDIMGAVMIA